VDAGADPSGVAAMKLEPRPALETTLYMALLVGLAVLINLLPSWAVAAVVLPLLLGGLHTCAISRWLSMKTPEGKAISRMNVYKGGTRRLLRVLLTGRSHSNNGRLIGPCSFCINAHRDPMPHIAYSTSACVPCQVIVGVILNQPAPEQSAVYRRRIAAKWRL
jgi:hypothetical protein